VITVAALGPNSVRSNYSNFGSAVEIAAPGGDVRSTTQPRLIPSIQGCNTNGQGNVDPATGCTTWGYGNFQGTSMSSPHVAGVIALMNAARVTNGLPKLNFGQALYYLQTTAAPLPANSDCAKGCGAGQVDAAAAVAAAAANSLNAPVLQIEYPAINNGTAGLDFGSSTTSGTLTLRNLSNIAGTFSLAASNNALSVNASTNTITANGTVTLNINLDRALSSSGAFIGSIVATASSGQKAAAPVLYTVGNASTDVGRMRVDVRNSTNTSIISRQVIKYVPGQGYLYRFVNIPSGSYYIVAVVDGDGNGTSEYYRCYPQTASGACASGQTLSIDSTLRTDNFGIFRDSSWSLAPYGDGPDTQR
jgi:serine protease